MAYDRQQITVSWLFKDLSSPEVAVTGLNLSAVGTYIGAVGNLAEIDVAGSTGNGLMAEMETLMSNPNLFWGNFSQLYAVKVAAVGTDGHYLTDPKIHEADVTYIGGSTTTVPQSTVVCSLRSGSGIGSANYGRMYLPHTRLGIVTATSSSNVATTAVVASVFKTFVNNVASLVNGDTTGVDVQPFIMSNQAPKPSKPVVQIGVGTVTDTQRRRRNRIHEDYSYLAI
jgi:hypothetical protein